MKVRNDAHGNYNIEWEESDLHFIMYDEGEWDGQTVSRPSWGHVLLKAAARECADYFEREATSEYASDSTVDPFQAHADLASASVSLWYDNNPSQMLDYLNSFASGRDKEEIDKLPNGNRQVFIDWIVKLADF